MSRASSIQTSTRERWRHIRLLAGLHSLLVPLMLLPPCTACAPLRWLQKICSTTKVVLVKDHTGKMVERRKPVWNW